MMTPRQKFVEAQRGQRRWADEWVDNEALMQEFDEYVRAACEIFIDALHRHNDPETVSFYCFDIEKYKADKLYRPKHADCRSTILKEVFDK